VNTDLCLNLVDFARAFGTTPGRISANLRAQIERSDFRYRKLTHSERDQVIFRVLKRIHSGELSKVGEHRKKIWEKGWEENLNEFASKGFALETLVPRFIRPEPIVRLNGDYVRVCNPRFEFLFHDVARRWLFLEFMAGVDAVYEFGCGSAYNLVAIAEIAPQLRLVGLDWAESAVRLTNMIGKAHQTKLIGRVFDFFDPDDSVELGAQDAAITICALEQVGSRYEDFLQFLLRKRPRICVHMEPLIDLYDPNNLLDYLAIRYHTLRHYLSGFLPRLKQLELEKRIEILAVQRMCFGSLYHEGYSCVVWRPC
jgi:hypothetical protein